MMPNPGKPAGLGKQRPTGEGSRTGPRANMRFGTFKIWPGADKGNSSPRAQSLIEPHGDKVEAGEVVVAAATTNERAIGCRGSLN
jgi:hypothetical protein